MSAATRDVALDVRAGDRVIDVESAAQMAAAMFEHFASRDVAIMAAAVADFTFDAATVEVEEGGGAARAAARGDPDIVTELAARRTPGQVVVAFAAETENLEARARDKLRAKGRRPGGGQRRVTTP